MCVKNPKPRVWGGSRYRLLAVCCSLVACCLLVFVSLGAGLVPMCVFLQTSSQLPSPYPTALDHRTSRSTPLISLSLFTQFCLISLEFPPPHPASFPHCLSILSPASAQGSRVSEFPFDSTSPFGPCVTYCCLPLFLPALSGSFLLLWLRVCSAKLWSKQNSLVMRWTLLTHN